jgi:hypothetical protein
MSTTPTPPTPGERFAGFIRFLTLAVVTQGCCFRIPNAMVGLIVERLRPIMWRFQRLAELIRQGKYTARRSPEPRGSDKIHAALGKPRPPSKLPRERGWLATYLPEAANQRGYLDQIMREPEMEAMLKIAPPTLIREIRSICWMLGLPANNIPALKRPARPRPSKPEPAPTKPDPSLAPPPVPISWKKPRGSISNRIYRNYRPPGTRGSKNSS